MKPGDLSSNLGVYVGTVMILRVPLSKRNIPVGILKVSYTHRHLSRTWCTPVILELERRIRRSHPWLAYMVN